jgi:hypothetical protein
LASAGLASAQVMRRALLDALGILDPLRSAQISSGGQKFGQKFSPEQRTRGIRHGRLQARANVGKCPPTMLGLYRPVGSRGRPHPTRATRSRQPQCARAGCWTRHANSSLARPTRPRQGSDGYKMGTNFASILATCGFREASRTRTGDLLGAISAGVGVWAALWFARCGLLKPS